MPTKFMSKKTKTELTDLHVGPLRVTPELKDYYCRKKGMHSHSSFLSAALTKLKGIGWRVPNKDVRKGK